MDVFTADYLANLTADLSAHLLAATGRRLREALSGTAQEQAVRRCVQAGAVALLSRAGREEPEARQLLAYIFRRFFRDEEVGRELAAVLRGNPLDLEELDYLFEQAGYDAETLPGLDFRQGIAAFEAAFLASAVEEPALQGTIQTGQLLAQTRLQRELVAAMRELVAFLRQARPGSVGIGAQQITAENVVSGMQVVYRLARVDVPQQPGDWEAHYLRTLVTRCDPLDLAPIDPAHPLDARPVHISDVFTTLYLEHVLRLPRQSIANAILQPRDLEVSMSRRSRSQKTEEPLPVQAVEAVAALPRLVILGRPGGGKSTLVNHIATQLARRRLGSPVDDAHLPGWPPDERPLPVRVVLRRFAAWLPPGTARGDAGLVWDYLEHLLRQWGCRDACDGLERVLTREGGVVFFDGLDEVRQTDAEAKRSLIKDSITAFAAPLENCKVVVTCREYAYKAGAAWRLPEAEFPVVELAPFNLEQVAAFVQTWYRVVGPQKGWDETKCNDEARNLCEAVRALPHLQELAQYPLLLTLMAQVHGRDGTLPEDRADLYEQAVDLLLAHWENRIVRDVESEQKVLPGLVMQLGIHSATLRAALSAVAFAAHERQEREPDRGERAADIPREDLRDALHADLGSVDRADTVIAYVQERAGLLQARDNRTYAFPHRTFQEYLAASHILKQGNFDVLLRDRVRRDLPWWQEVFLLAAGASRGTPRNTSDLVDRLLPSDARGSSVSAVRAAEARLAAQALHETGFTAHAQREDEPGRYSATLRRVQRWLLASLSANESLEPQERAACGAALGRIGDPRFRADAWFLPDDPLLGFAEVEAGPFLMGSDPDQDPDAAEYESPQRTVDLPAYWIARYPVTIAQYRAFVKDRDVTPGDADCLRGIDNHPVVWVSWHEALAYCRWLTERLKTWEGTPEPLAGLLRDKGWQVRLPSEAQWEKAARGGLEGLGQPNPNPGRRCPWGHTPESDGPDPNRANYYETGILRTSAVGCFPGGASPYGVLDMSGNVWEWCQTKWQDSYKEYIDDNNPDKHSHRVLRGGSFYYARRFVRCASRYGFDSDARYVSVGFRLVVAPVPSAL